MSFLNKILGRQPKKTVESHPSIRIFGPVPTDKLGAVKQIVRTYYTGKKSETMVVEEIKRVTGLRAGRVYLEYNKRQNSLTVFYCC